MNFYQLFQFIHKHQQHSSLPSLHAWPDEISLNTTVWDGVKKMYGFTDKDGHEYESSVFYVDGETVSTGFHRGTRERVYTSHQVHVRYIPQEKTKTYEKQIYIDNVIVRKSLYKSFQLPKRHELGCVINLHSHPAQMNEGEKTYSFFSSIDLNSLITSPSLILGLVTDELWIAVKTNKVKGILNSVNVEKLHMLNTLYFQKQEISSFLQDHFEIGIVFYRASFSHRLQRVN